VGVLGQYDACVNTANTTHSECSTDVVTNFTDCNANAETARTSCISIINTEYDACVVDMNALADNNRQTCMAAIQADYDGCLGDGAETGDACYAEAGVINIPGVSGTGAYVVCLQAAFDQNAANQAETQLQFDNMMATYMMLLSNPALMGYAGQIMDIALVNYTTNLETNLAIYNAQLSQCVDSNTVAKSVCDDELDENLTFCENYLDDSGCNAFTPDPLDNECTAYQASQLTQCDAQYSDNMSGCVDNQNIGYTGCSAELTSALNECGEILSGLDCGYCADGYDACTTTCHDQFGEGGGG